MGKVPSSRPEIHAPEPAPGEMAPWFEEALNALEACNPTTFDGQPHPSRTADWLRQIERVWRACEIPEEDWVPYTAKLLEGDAERFWQSLGEEATTNLFWKEFGDLFKVCFPARTPTGDFLPLSVRMMSQEVEGVQRRTPEPEQQSEGMRMKEGETVASYANRFVREVLSDRSLDRHWIFQQRQSFWEGLPEAIRQRVFPYLGQTIFQLIEDAKTCEMELLEEREDERDSPLLDDGIREDDAEASTSWSQSETDN